MALTSEGPINYCGTDTGSSNAFVCANPAGKTIKAYRTGNLYVFKAGHGNTGAATLAVDGLTATTMKKAQGGTDLASGDIASGALVSARYDGTNFQVTVLPAFPTGPIVGTSDTQTLTNKSLTASQTAVNTYTVATLPAGIPTNAVVKISDGNAINDCTTGGGSIAHSCQWNGTAWVFYATMTANFSMFNTFVAAASISFITPGYAANATESARQGTLGKACLVNTLYAHTSTTQSSAGPLVVTVRNNTSNTSVTFTVPASSTAGNFSDTTHSAAFAATDLLSIELDNSGTATGSSATLFNLGFYCSM
jgi:hypothetical protein